MKKKTLILLFFMVLFLVPVSTHALRPYEITSRKECEKFELATAKADGSLEKVACFDDYNSTKAKMYELTDNDDLVIIENGMIVDAKYGLVDYDQDFTKAGTKYVRVYANSTGSNEITYIRTAGCYADDAVLLDYDPNVKSKRVKIKVAGVTGWIGKEDDNGAILYDVVPLVWSKTPQYYSVTNDSIIHYFPKNMYGDNRDSQQAFSIDKKPDMLAVGTYYSYDGHYFYNDMKTLINDYKNNNYNNSVNKDKPYYNYYQYLSFRTKTNYNADNINAYINKRLGNNTESKLYNTASYFLDVQEKYGVNAILMLSIGINESGWGKSTIAQTKNNLFGLNAVDATPGQSANYFTSVKDCIETYGYKWLSYGYIYPNDKRFRGDNLGDKSGGFNVKYASDPFWSEKAAHYYYEIDKMYGFQDRNNYLLAVNTAEGVLPTKSVNGAIVAEDYRYTYKNSTVVVLETIKDASGNLWYKIQSDPNLDVNLNYLGSSLAPTNYNWNGYVYVGANNYMIISNPDDYDPQKITQDNSNQQTQPKEEIKTIDSIVNEANYKYEGGLVSGISLGTNANTIKDSLTKQGAKSVVVKDANGTVKESNILATGDKIEVTTNKTEVIEVVISGDINGDGKINSADLLRIRQYLLGTDLTGAYKQAALLGYSKINSANLLKIRQYLLGQTDISQK